MIQLLIAQYHRLMADRLYRLGRIEEGHRHAIAWHRTTGPTWG